MIVFLETLAGLALLLIGGDALVRGSVALARHSKLSKLFIGLTIVAFGTSAPELVTSIQAVLSGLPAFAIGKVVGSNIANVLIVLGLPALITPIICKGHGLLRTTLIMLAASLAFVLVAITGQIGFATGALFFGLLVFFLVMTTRGAMRGRDTVSLVDMEALEGPVVGVPMAIVHTIGGILGLIFGAHFLLQGGAKIAAFLGVPDAVIGLSLVALGTSLPELATSLAAAFRRHGEVAIGNVVGSNIFNILGIVGITAMVRPITVAPHFLALDIWVMLGSSLILLPIIWRHGKIGRVIGVMFTLAYVAYISTLAINWADVAPLS